MSVKLKICTFNLRTPVQKDEVNYLPNRKERILECIRKEDPDIIGFQEAAVYTADWLREVLDGYMIVGCGRGKTLNDEASLIAYRKNAFEMISAETFWLSLAPSVWGSRYGADQSSCPRVATAAVLSVCFGMDPIYQLLSGGIMLGAFFMATDYVTSPTTDKGKVIFGIGLGIITMMIRRFGTMNEGVSFAILLMNVVSPLIERVTGNKSFGEVKK